MVPGDEGILSNLRRGALEYCILAMLTERELYGLEIARRLTADGVLMSSEGTLYPLLARLRRAGLVDTTWQESVEGPPRYCILAMLTERELYGCCEIAPAADLPTGC